MLIIISLYNIAPLLKEYMWMILMTLQQLNLCLKLSTSSRLWGLLCTFTWKVWICELFFALYWSHWPAISNIHISVTECSAIFFFLECRFSGDSSSIIQELMLLFGANPLGSVHLIFQRVEKHHRWSCRVLMVRFWSSIYYFLKCSLQ